MPPTESAAPASPPASPPQFATTRWSLVLHAGGSSPSLAHEALTALCRTYWPPLYAYVRRRGHAVHDAQDLTQAFFARLLEQGWIERADPGKGRFRTFLLTALQRFLADEWDRARALKRGGAQPPVSLDALENDYQAFASTALSADRLYDRQWALALLDRTLSRLETEFARAGRAAEFAALKPFLTADRESLRYADAARAAGLTEGAARVAVHRLRRRYRELFRDEIAQTVDTPAEIEAELRHLMQSLATG
jgi:DNA-directed RNA polymerase specialized sigma24 family protein